MAALRLALAALMWLAVPANLIGGGTLLGLGLGAGYLKGHAVATRHGTVRVKAAVKQIETTIEEEAKLNEKAADQAAEAAPPVVPGPAHRPDRDAIRRLCASDSACRRDGS